MSSCWGNTEISVSSALTETGAVWLGPNVRAFIFQASVSCATDFLAYFSVLLLSVLILSPLGSLWVNTGNVGGRRKNFFITILTCTISVPFLDICDSFVMPVLWQLLLVGMLAKIS